MEGSFVHTIFFQRLPANVQTVLASTPDTAELETLSQVTDTQDC